MRTLTILLALSLTLACSKNKGTDPGNCFPFEHPWLEQKALELRNCTCETIILSGNYKGQNIYEVRVIDPLCNAIQTVHKQDGTPLFHSGEQVYQDHLQNVKNLKEVWRCSEQNK
jgi:hypothetical protein